jgi:hypothetical protein
MVLQTIKKHQESVIMMQFNHLDLFKDELKQKMLAQEKQIQLYESQLTGIQNSPTYKVSSLLLKPIKILLSLFRKN